MKVLFGNEPSTSISAKDVNVNNIIVMVAKHGTAIGLVRSTSFEAPKYQMMCVSSGFTRGNGWTMGSTYSSIQQLMEANRGGFDFYAFTSPKEAFQFIVENLK